MAFQKSSTEGQKEAVKKVQLQLQVANSFVDSGWSCTEAQEEEEEEERRTAAGAAAGAAAGGAAAGAAAGAAGAGVAVAAFCSS